MLKKIFKALSKCWNIYLGIGISILVAKILEYDKGGMDKTTSFLVMAFTICSVITIIKSKVFHKETSIIEKATMIQPSIKTMNVLLDGVDDDNEEDVKEMIEISERIGNNFMEKVKKFFKWVWTYRQQLIGLLGVFAYASLTVYAYINDKFGWLLQYFPDTHGWELAVKIGVGVISVVFVFFGVRNQVIWGGVGSLAKAKDYLEKLSSGVVAGLSPQARECIRHALKTLKANLKNLKSKHNKTLESYNNILKEIATAKELIALGLGSTTKSDELDQQKYNYEVELNNIASEIANAETQISKYQEVLGE